MLSSRSQRGFTLLEVMIATMILGMLTLTLYRFLSVHLTAIRITNEWSDQRDTVQGVIRLLRSQLNDLPPQSSDMLRGQPYKFHGIANDEITWRTPTGSGLLSAEAPGEFRVTLTIQPVDTKSSETELGLRRQPIDPKRVQDVNLDHGSGNNQYNWVPLIRPMAAIEIRYYDARANSWTDTWNDPGRYPTLVRVRLWKQADSTPTEAVIPVPAANTQP